MCGRFASGDLKPKRVSEAVSEVVEEETFVEPFASSARSGYHIRPSDRVCVAARRAGRVHLSASTWQITPQAGRPMINARIENEVYWAQAWRYGRCIIPAIGFFEWTAASGRNAPVYITVQRNAPFLFFAGFLTPDGQSCAIVTRDASPQIAELHHRMR